MSNDCACSIITPKLLDELSDAVDAAHNDGWGNEKDIVKLHKQIDKIAEKCDMYRQDTVLGYTYLKKPHFEMFE